MHGPAGDGVATYEMVAAQVGSRIEGEHNLLPFQLQTRPMNKAIKISFLGLLLCAMVIGAYLVSALVTARIERNDTTGIIAKSDDGHTIYLIANLLHADIAIPLNDRLLERFPMLQETPLPLNNPNMKYVLFGWGSRAFYTSAGSYADITVAAAMQAITGDQPVMRVSPAGKLTMGEGIIPVRLSGQQFNLLLEAILDGFSKTGGGSASRIAGASLSKNDAFFVGRGHFNIFHPCNQWVNNTLSKAGVRLGIWTPTTQSLIQSLRYFETDLNVPTH